MEAMSNGLVADTAFFSLATQIYVRLRRVTGRVIDASYLVENRDYAQYVINLALETGDAELTEYVARLRSMMGLDTKLARSESVRKPEADIMPSFSVF